jgi:hypothetical protein
VIRRAFASQQRKKAIDDIFLIASEAAMSASFCEIDIAYNTEEFS